MTTPHRATPHRATPDEWAAVQLHADPDAYCHRDSCILELHYRVEALEAAQQAVTEESLTAQDDAPQTLHTVALGMVDSLERLPVLPEILDTLRRAIQEPMEQSTPPPAPVKPAPAGWLVMRTARLLVSWFSESLPGTECTPFACDVLREVAAWMRTHQDPAAHAWAMRLEQEAGQ
jgi:hypothetical protein